MPNTPDVVDTLRAAINAWSVSRVRLVGGKTYFEDPHGWQLTAHPAEPLWSAVSGLQLKHCRADASSLLPPDLRDDWLCVAYVGPDATGRINALLTLYRRHQPGLSQHLGTDRVSN